MVPPPGGWASYAASWIVRARGIIAVEHLAKMVIRPAKASKASRTARGTFAVLAALLLGSAVPSSSFMVPQARFALRTQQQRTLCGGRLCSESPCIASRLRRHGGMALLRATTDTPLPADPAALQQRLWEAANVLPSLEETQLQLAKTQETGVSDLGFVAKGPISKGDIVISVPMRLPRT